MFYIAFNFDDKMYHTQANNKELQQYIEELFRIPNLIVNPIFQQCNQRGDL